MLSLWFVPMTLGAVGGFVVGGSSVLQSMKSKMPFRGHHLSIHVPECVFDIHFSSTYNLLVMAQKLLIVFTILFPYSSSPANVPTLTSFARTGSSPCLKTAGTPSLPANPALLVCRSKCTGRLQQIVFIKTVNTLTQQSV